MKKGSLLSVLVAGALMSMTAPNPSGFIDYPRSSNGSKDRYHRNPKTLKKRAIEKANKRRGRGK